MEEVRYSPDRMLWEARRTHDYNAAKAWIYAALARYPNDTSILFAAYALERDYEKEREAAEALVGLFNDDRHSAAGSLRAEVDVFMSQLNVLDSHHRRIFDFLPHHVQREMLELGSEMRPYDCRPLVELLERFPSATATHGSKLVEMLLREPPGRSSKTLVEEALPALGWFVCLQPTELRLRVLARAIDYYNSLGAYGDWRLLYHALTPLACRLGWDDDLVDHQYVLDRKAYVDRLKVHANDVDHTQLLYLGTAHLLRALNRYWSERQGLLLVEAFVETPDPNSSLVQVTGSPAESFVIAVECWELLDTSGALKRKFTRLYNSFRNKPWKRDFQIEMSLYRGRFKDACPKSTERGSQPLIRRGSVTFAINLSKQCLRMALIYVTCNRAPRDNRADVSPPTVAVARRHVHFLPMMDAAVVRYCAKLALRSIESGGNGSDLAAGNMLVLAQLDWPRERPTLQRIVKAIRQKGSFHYPPFKSYIINKEMLNEFAYLCTEPGGNVTLDIMPDGQRRVGPRSARRAIADVREMIRGQAVRCDDSIPELVTKFMSDEPDFIMESSF